LFSFPPIFLLSRTAVGYGKFTAVHIYVLFTVYQICQIRSVTNCSVFILSPFSTSLLHKYLIYLGNFSPNTQAGRVLVYCLGWLSIIAFGGIIYIAGYTYATIADDLFRRFNIKWLQRPEYSAPLWGVFGLSWICLVALKARQYWDTRVPSFDYTVSDSYWFSYITVLTVGEFLEILIILVLRLRPLRLVSLDLKIFLTPVSFRLPPSLDSTVSLNLTTFFFFSVSYEQV
jgi:hypothetical protein